MAVPDFFVLNGPLDFRLVGTGRESADGVAHL